MSAFARAQLEKYGWQDGQGLGRNKEGITTYIRTSLHNRATHNRDERGASYAGIGHESTRGGGASTAEKASELDVVLDDIARRREERLQRERALQEQAAVAAPATSERKREEQPEQPVRQRRRARAPPEDESLAAHEEEPAKSAPTVAPTVAPPKAASASDSDSDAGATSASDLARMSDSALLAACGGVRLGRAGRHRLFDAKLRRIEEQNREAAAQGDPYAQARRKQK
jgi:hypothetical protein